MESLEIAIHLFSVCMYLLAIIVMTRFWFQLKDEKYWIGLPLSMLAFFIHEVLEIINDFTDYNTKILVESFEIIGAVILIYSIFGLTSELVRIHKLESEAEELED